MEVGQQGVCLWCDAPGSTGDACTTASCARRGYHYVPSGDAANWHARGGATDSVLGRRFGEYLVVDVLGAGGMGAVYRAVQWPLGLQTALKVLTGGSEALASRFRGEAAALARLSHPNIVRVYGFGVEGSQ